MKFNFEILDKFQCAVDTNHKYYDSRYKFWYGGRGSSKSTQVVKSALFRSMYCKKLRGRRILCSREYQNSIDDSVKTLIEDQIEILEIGHLFDVTGKLIICIPTGVEFIFKGLSGKYANSVKSIENIGLAIVEEGQTVVENSWKILTPTIRKKGSEIWAVFNPNKESDPVYQRSIVNPLPGSYVCKVNYYDNPWFPEELRMEMEWDKKRDYDKYLNVWEGECVVNSEARVFKNWKIEPIEPPEEVEFLFGADWGFSVDPTTLNRMWFDHDNRKLFIDYEAHKVGCEIDQTPDLFETVPGAKKWVIRADSARPETISYMKRQGFKIKPAKKGAGSVEEGISFLQSYDIIIHPRCKRTIDEFIHYSYKVSQLTGDILPVLEDKNNHHIDDIRYATEPLWSKRGMIHVG